MLLVTAKKYERSLLGFHRKMKLIQRRAYGFRNENYRVRVKVLCG
nr:transposase [Legionella gratiana]